MAQVDFSNAVLTPHTYNPVTAPWMGLYSNSSIYPVKIVDSNGNVLTSSLTARHPVDGAKRGIYTITGTFNTSGTEFYIIGGGTNYTTVHWKVSGVTFASGDTFTMQISTTLIAS